MIWQRKKTDTNCRKFKETEAEFKEFEPQFKFKPRLKYGWFNLKLYKIFQDLCRRIIETGFGDLRRSLHSLNSDTAV